MQENRCEIVRIGDDVVTCVCFELWEASMKQNWIKIANQSDLRKRWQEVYQTTVVRAEEEDKKEGNENQSQKVGELKHIVLIIIR
jgi:hypothetical protein